GPDAGRRLRSDRARRRISFATGDRSADQSDVEDAWTVRVSRRPTPHFGRGNARRGHESVWSELSCQRRVPCFRGWLAAAVRPRLPPRKHAAGAVLACFRRANSGFPLVAWHRQKHGPRRAKTEVSQIVSSPFLFRAYRGRGTMCIGVTDTIVH